MASKQSNVDFVLEQMAEAGPVSARKMFGEYAIYRANKLVALFCDDQLFVKPTDGGRSFIGEPKEGAPYPGAKPWFSIGGDRCEDSEWLAELVRVTAAELPEPKPKAPKKPRASAVPKPKAKPRKSPVPKKKPATAKKKTASKKVANKARQRTAKARSRR